MAREMLFAPVLVVDAERVAVVPVSRPDMAAVINRDFIVALVIGVFLSKWVVDAFCWLSALVCRQEITFAMPMGPFVKGKVTHENEILFHHFLPIV
jgi:hypothetical protein